MSTMIKWGFAFLALAFWNVSFVVGQCNLIKNPVISGKKFFDSRSGEYIPIKGVNYYPRPNEGELSTGNGRDFFSEEYRDIWERDIMEFMRLGINVLRLYSVDPGLDHSGFMCALQSAGIYVIVGLAASCENCAITEGPPPDCYPGDLKRRGEYIINTFSKYENVLAFSAGNEVALYEDSPEVNAPCQKQFIRDMRAYVKSCPSMRQIPIGVVVADVDRMANALYYNCRSDPDDELENAEWYGINVYLHCDGSAQTTDELIGYQELLEDFKSFEMSIPVVLAEFGCINESFDTIDGFESQRNFLQVDAIFSPEYAQEFAGGIAFEYSTEKNFVDESTNSSFPYQDHASENFGLGFFTPEECDDLDTPCVYNQYPNFENLAERYAAVDTSLVPSLDDYEPATRGMTQCPDEFPALSRFSWESASVEPYGCPPDEVFTCPDYPPECGPTVPPTPPPTTAGPTSFVLEPTIPLDPDRPTLNEDGSSSARAVSTLGVLWSASILTLVKLL